MKNQGIVVLDRALAILHYVATHRGEADLTRIATGVGLGKSTVHRLLKSLEDAGLVMRDPGTQRYNVGYRVFEYAFATRKSSSLTRTAYPYMVRLAEAVGETVGLHVQAGDHRLCIEEVESTQLVRYAQGVGSTRLLGIGAVGKLLLAWQPPERRQVLLDRLPLQALTPFTIVDKELLAAELASIRRRRYAISVGEVDEAVFSVAAPVVDFTGSVVAALNATGPRERLQVGGIEAIARELCKTAAAVSATFGYVDSGEPEAPEPGTN